MDDLNSALNSFEHSYKGTTWKKHAYIKKENGRYIYPKNYAGKIQQKGGTSGRPEQRTTKDGSKEPQQGGGKITSSGGSGGRPTQGSSTGKWKRHGARGKLPEKPGRSSSGSSQSLDSLLDIIDRGAENAPKRLPRDTTKERSVLLDLVVKAAKMIVKKK